MKRGGESRPVLGRQLVRRRYALRGPPGGPEQDVLVSVSGEQGADCALLACRPITTWSVVARTHHVVGQAARGVASLVDDHMGAGLRRETKGAHGIDVTAIV